MVWRDSVGVEGSGSELKIRVRGYFSSEFFSGCCAILTSPKKGETAVYGYNPILPTSSTDNTPLDLHNSS